MIKPMCIRMTGNACKTLHKLEARRDKAIESCAKELMRLIAERMPEYSIEDARARSHGCPACRRRRFGCRRYVLPRGMRLYRRP